MALSLKLIARTRKLWMPVDNLGELNLPLSLVTPRLISSIHTMAFGSLTIVIVRAPLVVIACRGRCATATPQQRSKMQAYNFIVTTFTPNDPQRASVARASRP